jgi:ligand-binding sensor domain-containing protein/signal transduction histidine kinase
LEKFSSKQICFWVSSHLWCYLTLIYFTGASSCNEKPIQLKKPETGNKWQAIPILPEKDLSPPKKSQIFDANLPKSERAGKPNVRIDSTNKGLPFFTNYSLEQGLLSNNITSGIIDKNGNLWFGTDGAGVSKFDGKGFTNYTSANGLPSNEVSCIMADKDDNIWFGTLGGGASKYDGKRFTNYSKKDGLAGDGILCIIQDRAGKIWFCSAGDNDGGISVFDGSHFKNFTIAHGLNSNKIRTILEDRSGEFWIGTDAGVSKFNGTQFTNYTVRNGLANGIVNSIVQDKSGFLWFGTQGGGVSRYDGKTFSNYTTIQGLVDNRIRSIFQDSGGNLWFGSDGGGVSKFDGNVFSNYTTNQGLADNSLRSIIQDKNGNLWFCTIGGGVSKYNYSCLSYYIATQWLNNYLINSIIKDNSGNLWLGTNGLSKYDGKKFVNYDINHGQSDIRISDMILDNKGNIWLGTSNGAKKFDGEKFVNYSVSEGLAQNSILAVMQDNNGAIWFGTEGGGVSKFDGKSFLNFSVAQGLPSNYIHAIKQDKKGVIWFGTDNGISKFDGRHFTNFAKEDKAAGDKIFCIIQDKNGNMWFGTDGGGACKYDGNKFTNYTTALGLPDNIISAIAEDTMRNLIWFATDKGLAGLSENPPVNGSKQGDQFEIFNYNSGYPIVEVNTLCPDNKGILWLGCGDNKLIRFDYGALKKNTEPLSLEIQNIKLNNENICWNNLYHRSGINNVPDSLALLNEMFTTFGRSLPQETLDSMHDNFDRIRFDSIGKLNPIPVNLVLPYQYNSISFDFVAIEPDLPRQVKYQYILEGYNKEWSSPANSTTAVFGNLNEGNYSFRLRALSPYGAWSESLYKFTVLPPWFRTWVAYLAYVVSLVGFIWVFIYYRSKQLRYENRILEEKISLRTDQLKVEKEKVEQTLTELKSTQVQLIQSEKMASLGELTAGIAHEIQNPLNFVNNFSEVNGELIEEIFHANETGEHNEIRDLLSILKENEEKIKHHGKRADAIVKEMLQHSRANPGIKEPTELNALADEYFRLAYHGFRARDKSFNVKMITEYDKAIGNINIIPQDIGRVLLNLYNNAFYAVSEKKKSADTGFQPSVSVTTKQVIISTGEKTVSIIVKDNGCGIPQKVVDKIFQPFFTTKPTGQGTGLGLSLSYDMVKAHGGEIRVETKEGEGTAFSIRLLKI